MLAKPEVKRAIASAQTLLRSALPEGSFGEREAALLSIMNEATRHASTSS
jgi:hypothetical protein